MRICEAGRGLKGLVYKVTEAVSKMRSIFPALRTTLNIMGKGRTADILQLTRSGSKIVGLYTHITGNELGAGRQPERLLDECYSL